MTREYQTLIGDGRECVTVHYEIIGEPDDFDIEVMAIYFAGAGINAVILTLFYLSVVGGLL